MKIIRFSIFPWTTPNLLSICWCKLTGYVGLGLMAFVGASFCWLVYPISTYMFELVLCYGQYSETSFSGHSE